MTTKAISTQQANKTITVLPASMLDGIFAEVLASCYHSIGTMRKDQSNQLTMSRVDNIRAVASLVYLEVKTLLDGLTIYSSSSLSPKHLKCRNLLLAVCNVIDGLGLEKAKTPRHSSCVQFAKLSTDFLSTFHRLLHSNTNMEQRELALVGFLHRWINQEDSVDSKLTLTH
jgi:hypothetical protein